MLNSQTIPAWVVGVNMLFAGFVWIITRKHYIRMDSRIMGITMITEGIVYTVVFQFLDLPIETRAFLSRLMLIILCLSQYLPLTISHLRHINDSK